MRNTLVPPFPVPLSPLRRNDWAALAAVLLLGAALRLLFYSGFLGSDEVTYVEAATRIVAGDWQASSYIGATRYGMNLPMALSIYLFGISEASANLWPFLCSIGEIATVFVVARWLWGRRAAVICAGLLALLPLHIHFAGRMMADTPLAFFLTLSVALLLYAASSGRGWSYLAAGLAWGAVFWVKEVVGILYFPVFVLLAIYLLRIDRRWLWLLAGVVLAAIASSVLMYFVAGNALHLYITMQRAMVKMAGGPTDTSPWFYLHYLFMDIKHTFLLGFLVLGSIVVYVRGAAAGKLTAPGTRFALLWFALLFGMFSFAVLSLSPLKMVTKQTNYILIFAAPMVLLAGWFLSTLSRRVLLPVCAVTAAGCFVLAALEQQAIIVFTANSRAAYTFLRDRPDAHLAGTDNNERAIIFFSMLDGQNDMRNRAMPLTEVTSRSNGTASTVSVGMPRQGDVFALLDMQNVEWGEGKGAIRRLADVPPCWTPMGTLAPAALGSGRWITRSLTAAAVVFPASLRQRYLAVLQPVTQPANAYLFKVERSCYP